MIKRTLYFGTPAYLSSKHEQLAVKFPDTEKEDATIPIEDIGIVILDNPQITITQTVVTKFLENNVAVIHCNNSHLPVGLVLNLDGNTLQSQKFKAQIEATASLKKQLWQQTVEAKIKNQAALLHLLGKDTKKLDYLSERVKSGDSNNNEAQAAVIYWGMIFADYVKNFKRDRYGEPPNNILNYGYAILRATVARALAASGLLPTLGIFHKNQYNAYCLADDIMEPYRPFVDRAVITHLSEPENIDLTPTVKRTLLEVLQQDVFFSKEHSPLFIAISNTTASLAACFEGKKKKILYPKLK